MANCGRMVRDGAIVSIERLLRHHVTTVAHSNGTINDPLRSLLPQNGVSKCTAENGPTSRCVLPSGNMIKDIDKISLSLWAERCRFLWPFAQLLWPLLIRLRLFYVGESNSVKRIIRQSAMHIGQTYCHV